MTRTGRKQIVLGAYFPGVNHDTVWSDPASGSHIDWESFEHWARTAERGKLDLLFLAEGLRLRTRGGEVFDQDVVGRPDTFTVLAALAGGAAGPGRMRDVSPLAGDVLVQCLTTFGLGGLLGGLAMTAWQRRAART